MKKFLLAFFVLVGLAGLGSVAFASDLPARSAPSAPAYVANSFPTFSGFYVGVNGGYEFGHFDSSVGSTKLDGGSLGVNAGYDKRFGDVVVGVEADFAGFRKASSPTAFAYPATTSLEFLGTVRGRLGYVLWDKLMIYGTGGFAYAAIDTEVLLPTGLQQKQGRVSPGYVYGAGAEYAFADHWSVKGEYLRVNLRSGSYDLVGDNGKFKADIARVGVNYRF